MNRGDTRTGLRDLLNEPSPGFWSDDLLNRFINRAFLEVYIELVQANEAFFATTINFTFVAGTQLYTLAAAGIARILYVEYRGLAIPVTIRPIPLQAKNEWELAQASTGTDLQYRYFLLGNQIGFTPTPQIALANAVRVYATPEPALPTTVGNGQDSFDWPAELTEMHHELIVWLAFIRAITKDRELVTAHMPHVSRLWDLLKADNNRRQHQESMGFELAGENYG